MKKITNAINDLPRSRLRMYRAALAYRAAGMSFYPVAANGDKAPAFELLPRVPRGRNGQLKRSWGVFRGRQPSVAEIRSWFRDQFPEREYGLAIICGAPSGGLEVIDIDDFEFVPLWSKIVDARCPGLLDRLVRVQTPRPGLHFYYRSAAVGANSKLAQIAVRKFGETEWQAKTIIEVKGEGGCCLAPPSPPACHPAGRAYEVLGALDLTVIPTITEKERQILFDSARQLDTWNDHQRAEKPDRRNTRKGGRSGAALPGEDFNQRAAWAEVLEPHGWQLAGDDGCGTDFWRRPGKSSGTSASTNYEGSDLLFVFSSNASPFNENTAYSKFHAYLNIRRFSARIC